MEEPNFNPRPGVKEGVVHEQPNCYFRQVQLGFDFIVNSIGLQLISQQYLNHQQQDSIGNHH